MPRSTSSSGQESSKSARHRKRKSSRRHHKSSKVSKQLKELTGAVTSLVKSFGEHRSRSLKRRCSRSSSSSPPNHSSSSSESERSKKRHRAQRSPSNDILLGSKSHTDKEDMLEEEQSKGEKGNQEVLTLHPEIDDDDIRLLGAANESLTTHGAQLHPKIAKRWEEIAVKGLNKEQQKELVAKCSIPSNCTLIGAPVLNREIETALSAYTSSRDKQLFEFQTQLAYGMSEMGKMLNQLFAAKKNNEALLTEPLTSACNAAQLFLNVQNSLSTHRRQIIIPNIKAAIKDVVVDNPIGLHLFGDDLLEKVKKAEEMSKVGATITQKPRSTPRESGPQKKSTGGKKTTNTYSRP